MALRHAWRRASPGALAALTALAALAACSGHQSALDPAGAQAADVAGLWWTMFAISCVVIVLVTAFALAAVFRRRRSDDHADQDRRSRRAVVVGTGITVAILIVTFAYSMVVSRSAAALESPDAPEIQITGHQWWWDVLYHDPVPANVFRTANELHLPAGQTVKLRLTSRDVIHSFWAPNLHGKLDLVPGQENTLFLRAERPGVYRAQCAEFCGLQHAKMALDVVVHEPAGYEAWLEAQRRPAPEPADSLTRAGQQVFLQTACATCHAVRGTPANAVVGPDLTHLASRLTIAAGVLPNTRGHLGGWVADPQGPKPGNRMPRVPLSSREHNALLAYLQLLR